MPSQLPSSIKEDILTPTEKDDSSGEYHYELEGIELPSKYDLPVDPLQGDKATKIKLCSVKRPHMRSFHFAWASFFSAFVGWFSIPPLMPTIKNELNLTKAQVDDSNIVSVTSTIIARLTVGPMCDRFGPRTVQSTLLIVGAIPVACAAFVNSANGLIIIRFFIGFIGCTFVCTQYWTSIMFAKEVVGTANAITGGWGNLGAGATFLVMPLLFDLVTINGNISDDLGWRITLLFPAVALFVVGVLMFLFSDDSPKGNYRDLKAALERGERNDHNVVNPKDAFSAAFKNHNTWILFVQYACCFGIELQVNNIIGLYFYEDFTKDDCNADVDENKCRILTQTTAGLIASLFGLMNLFARALGGIVSDKANARFSMKGRLYTQFIFLLLEGVFLLSFSRSRHLGSSIGILLFFSLCTQASEGATFGIVPYVIPHYTGAIAGIVGAGGNFGAMCWGFLFKNVSLRSDALMYLSFFVFVGCALTPFIYIRGQSNFFRRKGQPHQLNA